MSESERNHLVGLGAFIRSQRRLAQLSQRELAKLTKLSDPYVSQLERGLHEPSVRVVRSLGKALNVPTETLLSYIGLRDETTTPGDESTTPGVDTVLAIKQDPRLSDAQKAAMLEIYKGFTDSSDHSS